jgi:hypothetical protein
MTNVLFLLIGIAVLDMLMSHNRRRFPQQPPQYWDGMPPYTPPTHYAPPTHFSAPHYSQFRHESAQYPPYRRETSPAFATMVFMVVVVLLMFWAS